MSHKDDINLLYGRLNRIIGMLCGLEVDLEIIYDELEGSERTCEMRADGAHCMNGVEFYECRYCGEYACVPTAMGKSEPPNYCPNCGARVVSE